MAERDRHGDALQTGVCLDCGLVGHLAVPSEEELAEFYAREYREAYHGETTPSPRRVVRAWRNAKRIYRQLAAHLEGSESVFEVGAGIGCNVKVFEMAGHRAAGIEPGEGFQDFSRQSLQADVERETLFHLPDLPKHDLVLLVHVIEHFASPSRALEKIHRLIRPGGRLYVECPNLAAPFAARSRLFHFAHVHSFTPATLGMLAGKCGFAVERQFSSPRDPNLQVLFKRTAKQPLRLDASSCAQTLESLGRYNLLSYHLRPGYLWARVKKVAGYLDERFSADLRVRRIVARCQERRQAPLYEPKRSAA